MTQPPSELDYVTPEPRPAADRFRVFLALLPIGVLVGVFVGSAMFEDGDSRNIGGAICMLAMVPLGLIGLAVAIRESGRPRGGIALLNGALGVGLIAAGLCGALWAIMRFRLLRH